MQSVIYIGFNNPKKHKRGVENVIEVQAGSLSKDVRTFYLFFDDRSSVGRWGRILCIGVKKGPLRFFRMSALMRTLLQRLRNRNTIIHSHNYLITALLYRRTNIFTVHDGLWELKKSWGSRVSWVFWFIERLAYMRSDHIHCNSSYTYASSQLPAMNRKSEIIYCSTPFEIYARKYTMNTSKSSSCFTVLSVRSIEYRARIDLIIAVAKVACERNLDVRFFVVGKGPLLGHYQGEIAKHGLSNVVLMGYLSDQELVAQYYACDCVLVTCEYGEGFGLPVIEGYYFGKPVIASNRCAIPEVICDMKYLVSNNIESIIECVELIKSERQDKTKFVKYYNSRFSNEIVQSQFRKFYELVFSAN